MGRRVLACSKCEDGNNVVDPPVDSGKVKMPSGQGDTAHFKVKRKDGSASRDSVPTTNNTSVNGPMTARY